MTIVITGASGFVGTALAQNLIDAGYSVTGIGTSKRHPRIPEGQLNWICADTTRPGPWQEAVSSAEVIINLTGRTIFSYWTKAYKQEIYNSRILTTRHIVDALEKDSTIRLLNASAVGFYGDTGETETDETFPGGSDFLATVCTDWEKEADRASEKGARVALMRFGVVLDSDGGALEKMVPAFKLFAGGPMGKGTHWFPWIHLEDLIRAVRFLMDHQNLTGPFNLCAPGSVRQKTFARALGRALGRPSFMPAPAFMLKLIMGEMSHALMSSQRAVPNALTRDGYHFKYPEIDAALASILRTSP